MTTPTQPHLQPSPEQEKRIEEIAAYYWNALRDKSAGLGQGNLKLALTELAADFAKEKAELQQKYKNLQDYVLDQPTRKQLADALACLSTLRSANAELEKEVSWLKQGTTERNTTIAELERRLAMAEDAANKGDDARTRMGAMESLLAEMEAGLVMKDNFHGNAVDDIALAMAGELEEANLDPNDLVSINREKLRLIARRVLNKADETLRTQLADTQAKLEEAEKKHQRLTELYSEAVAGETEMQELERLQVQNVALAAALKQVREAVIASNNLFQQFDQYWCKGTDVYDYLDQVRKLSSAQLKENTAALAAPADLGMVERMGQQLADLESKSADQAATIARLEKNQAPYEPPFNQS